MSTLIALTDRCYDLFWRQWAAALLAWILSIRLAGDRIFETGGFEQLRRIERLEQAALILDRGYRIVHANRAARQLFFRGRGFVLGRQVCVALPWLDSNKLRDMENAGRNRKVCFVEGEASHVFNLQMTPIYNARRNLMGSLAVFQPVAAEAADAETRPAAGDTADLLAKVSHDLRNPLSSIISISEMLDYGVYGPLSPEQRDAVRLISDATQMMTRLVNDLLEQAHLERGDLQIDETDFILDDLVNRLRKTARPKATAKGLWLTFDISPEMPLTLRGDPFRLFQVLNNLIDNAIKYTLTGMVAVKFIRISDDVYAIQVVDTGLGIPREQQDAIFEPFRQVHPGASGGEGENGYGLGLSIVKQLVMLMQGEIQVSSEVGKGSTFAVKLPLRTPLEIKY